MTATTEMRPQPALLHVAAADEGRGRVIVVIVGETPDPRAVRAACDLATIYDSAIEGIYVENTELFQAASHPFVRQILLSGRFASSFNVDDLTSDVYCLGRSALRKLRQSLAAVGKACSSRSIRDSLDAAIATACAENGPWNIVVMGDAFAPQDLPKCIDLLERTAGLTAIWTAPTKPLPAEGPIIVVVDQDDNLQQMVRFSDRLRALDPTQSIPIVVLLLGVDSNELDDREGRVRLALATSAIDTASITIKQTLITDQTSFELEEVIAHHNPRLVIAQAQTLAAAIEADMPERFVQLPYQVLIVR
jgi:hypothetical protein